MSKLEAAAAGACLQHHESRRGELSSRKEGSRRGPPRACRAKDADQGEVKGALPQGVEDSAEQVHNAGGAFTERKDQRLTRQGVVCQLCPPGADAVDVRAIPSGPRAVRGCDPREAGGALAPGSASCGAGDRDGEAGVGLSDDSDIERADLAGDT